MCSLFCFLSWNCKTVYIKGSQLENKYCFKDEILLMYYYLTIILDYDRNCITFDNACLCFKHPINKLCWHDNETLIRRYLCHGVKLCHLLSFSFFFFWKSVSFQLFSSVILFSLIISPQIKQTSVIK